MFILFFVMRIVWSWNCPLLQSQAKASCWVLFMQEMPWAFCLALVSTGNSRAAKMAMMAITTRSSIKVKPRRAAA